jgi:hypothetical protein
VETGLGAFREERLTVRLDVVFGRNLRSVPGIFGIEAGSGHDGASKVFGGKDEGLGGSGLAGIFFGGRSDEAIAAADDGQKVLGFAGIVGESAADFADGGIDALFDVDEDIFAAPQLGGDLLARDQSAAVFDQKHEQLQGQALQSNRDAMAAELKTSVIQLEIVEADLLLRHGTTPRD